MNPSGKKADRILQIEALLLAHPEGLSQSELARHLGVHRSTINRYFPSLPKHIYIEDDNGKVSHIETHDTGTFIGESGIAYGAPRNAHCVAAENTTCLVFSPGEPTSFAGRGEGAQFATDTGAAAEVEAADMSLISIDVQAFINHKVRALSQHRSQYPITPDLFPSSVLEEVMGHEHFKLVWSSEAADFDHALVHVDSSSG